MEFFDVIYGRRSIRSYLTENGKIERKTLDKLIDAGRWAPTAGNNQPWSFIVIDDFKQIEKVKSVSPGMFNEPAFVIAICINKNTAVRMGSQGELLALMDVCMAAQNILLAAHDLGFGACVIRSFHQKAVSVLLGCPSQLIPELLIAGGHPEGSPSAPSRKGIEEIRYFGRWDDR